MTTETQERTSSESTVTLIRHREQLTAAVLEFIADAGRLQGQDASCEYECICAFCATLSHAQRVGRKLIKLLDHAILLDVLGPETDVVHQECLQIHDSAVVRQEQEQRT